MNKLQVKQFIKWFKSLDKESEEFFDIWSELDQHYWTFEGDEDDYQKSAKLLHMWAMRGDEWLVILSTKILSEIVTMVQDNLPAVSALIEFESGKQFHFTLSKDKTALSSLQKVLSNTLIQKNKEGRDD